MLETEDQLRLFIALSYFVGFVSGVFCALLYRRHNAREAQYVPFAAAEGKLRREGKERSIDAAAVNSFDRIPQRRNGGGLPASLGGLPSGTARDWLHLGFGMSRADVEHSRLDVGF
jgi:hypothetical protein